MIRVMVVGLGAIGVACARAVATQSDLEITAIVDCNPDKVGRSLRDLAGAANHDESQDAGPITVADIEEAMVHQPQVAVLATTSQFDRQAAMIEWLLERQVAVVSSCEQMVWPWYEHEKLAHRVDKSAQRAGRAALAVGVNPGFVMDALAVTLSSMVRRVSKVRCVRRVNASVRRRALQEKVGATLSRATFEERARRAAVGHAGLAESVALVAAGLSRRVAPGSIDQTLEPVIAERCVESALGLVEVGQVAGVHHTAQWHDDSVRIELDLTMAVGLENPRDTIRLEGPVPIELNIPGSIPGDSATVATLLNHIPMVHHAAPGLRTMLDLPPAGCIHRRGD